jgi:hypothetical protein
MICFSYYLLSFLFKKIGEQEGKTGSAISEQKGLEMAQKITSPMYPAGNQ